MTTPLGEIGLHHTVLMFIIPAMQFHITYIKYWIFCYCYGFYEKIMPVRRLRLCHCNKRTTTVRPLRVWSGVSYTTGTHTHTFWNAVACRHRRWPTSGGNIIFTTNSWMIDWPWWPFFIYLFIFFCKNQMNMTEYVTFFDNANKIECLILHEPKKTFPFLGKKFDQSTELV